MLKNIKTMNEPKLLGAAIASIMLLSVLGSVGLAFADEIPENEIEDHGEFWSLTIHMIFAGADAESVEWDFGDGSPVSTEWNPSHTYAEPGTYIVTQIVYNSFEGGSESTAYYRIHVMGNPYVEIIQPEGAPEIADVYAKIRTAPEQPDDPVWEGREFVGWFADEEYTVPFDWDEKLLAPVKAYAGYSGFATVTHDLTILDENGETVTVIKVTKGATAVKPAAPAGKTAKYYIDEEQTEEFDWNTEITEDLIVYRVLKDTSIIPDLSPGDYSVNGTEKILIGAGVLALIAGLATRRLEVGVISIIVLGIAATGVFDVIQIPDIMEYFQR